MVISRCSTICGLQAYLSRSLTRYRFHFSLAAVHDRLLRIESSHMRSLFLRGELGNHTIHSRELLRVTVRVNLGAMQGYVRL
jgi:hypothetical protein